MNVNDFVRIISSDIAIETLSILSTLSLSLSLPLSLAVELVYVNDFVRITSPDIDTLSTSSDIKLNQQIGS